MLSTRWTTSAAFALGAGCLSAFCQPVIVVKINKAGHDTTASRNKRDHCLASYPWPVSRVLVLLESMELGGQPRRPLRKTCTRCRRAKRLTSPLRILVHSRGPLLHVVMCHRSMAILKPRGGQSRRNPLHSRPYPVNSVIKGMPCHEWMSLL